MFDEAAEVCEAERLVVVVIQKIGVKEELRHVALLVVVVVCIDKATKRAYSSMPPFVGGDDEQMQRKRFAAKNLGRQSSLRCAHSNVTLQIAPENCK